MVPSCPKNIFFLFLFATSSVISKLGILFSVQRYGSGSIHIWTVKVLQIRVFSRIGCGTTGIHYTNIVEKGTSRQVIICLTPPPRYTLYTYMYSFTKGRGGGGVYPERRLEGQQFTKLGQKNQQYWMYLQSIISDKHLPQSPFTGQFF
jgi:hypothetical protein